MISFLVTVATLVPGYLIPVLASLFFSLIMGRVAPEMLSQNGRIKSGFVMLHTVVWGLASVGSGYVIAMYAPRFKAGACVVGAALLIAALWSNTGLMKKKQTPGQFGGMVAATVVGIAVGLEIFLKMSKNV